MQRMRYLNNQVVQLLLAVFLTLIAFSLFSQQTRYAVFDTPQKEYWMLLERKSNREFLYYGIPGQKEQSKREGIFRVKTGIPGERPTPLPQLFGREYWLITKKYSSVENPETAPYFLELDVPGGMEEPFGPVPYLECEGSEFAWPRGQCNWAVPGEFGLHGINGDLTRLSDEDLGSSGCIRHKDEDITYLFNLLKPEEKPVRYYIQNT